MDYVTIGVMILAALSIPFFIWDTLRRVKQNEYDSRQSQEH